MKLKLNTVRLPSMIALRTFEAAARYASFTEAARELNVTLGAVSRQISRLEDELGVTLFTRKGNAVFLNETGKALSTDVTRAFGILRLAADRARPAPKNLLKLTCTMGIASHWLANRLPALQNQGNLTGLSIDASENIRDLAAGDADIAIRYCPVSAPAENARLLLADAFYPMISPALMQQADPGITIGDLPAFRLIDSPWTGREGGGIPAWPAWFSAFAPDLARPIATLSYNSVGSALQDAIEGKGIVLGSRAVAYDALTKGDLMAVFGADFQLPADHEFRVVWPDHILTDDVKRWINLLLEAAGQTPMVFAR